MDRKSFSQAYIDIETKGFPKADRTEKLKELLHEVKSSEVVFTIADVLGIIGDLKAKDIIIRQVLFNNILYPTLSQEVEFNNVEAIRALIKLDDQLYKYYRATKNNKYFIDDLLIKGLEVAPNDEELLKLYQGRTESYLRYTLHELPMGVLYGQDGATIEQCDELLYELSKYEDACKKLKLDRHELIRECRFYYAAYKNYLAVYQDFNGFADYLEKENKNR
jgi:hypothetical protein